LGKNPDIGKSVYWDPFITKPEKLTNQHILIVGKSGAGKTQTTSAFLWELSKACVPSIIFDFQGEYISSSLTNRDGKSFLECTGANVLDAADGINVNPLEVPIDPHSGKKQTYIKVVYQVANSLAKIFGLGDIQHAILRESITQIAPLGWEHISFNGDYVWPSQPLKQGFRPLRNSRSVLLDAA
jgi:Helicase HerA, central domain